MTINKALHELVDIVSYDFEGFAISTTVLAVVAAVIYVASPGIVAVAEWVQRTQGVWWMPCS